MTTKRLVSLWLGGAMLLSVPRVSAGLGGAGAGAGGGSAGTAAGALYGDLYVIERDGNGEPVLVTTVAAGVTYTCQQPLAADCSYLPLNGWRAELNPELEDACAVQAEYATGLQAVSFGRESVARAPATVIDKSYGEALKSLNGATADCKLTSGEIDPRAIKPDPAGRIAFCSTDPVTGDSAWKAIDAPLENLGLYRAAMTAGCFGKITDEVVGEEGVRETVTIELTPDAKLKLAAGGFGHLVCPDELTITVPDQADLLSAAAFLAAGADKGAPISLDQVINLNNDLGVNKWTYTTVKKVKTLTITYFEFNVAGGPGGWFGYTKGIDAADPNNPDNTVELLTHVGGLNFQINLVSVFGGPNPGVALTDVTVCRAGAPLPFACDDARYSAYSSSNIHGCGGANWFAQAAEHARKTIWFLHNFEPPVVAY